uniref:ATP synthase complex subunit 8 n=1 Tax=Symphylus caribbeanus TaxID=2080411 RepID=A0A2P1CLU6_9HEMI|nr:ATP synthase F0 subunit 8 [Symphylus caribbeanus]
MPQMAPLYWEVLFIMFVISLVLMSVIIYHSPKISSVSEMKSTMDINQINWKW